MRLGGFADENQEPVQVDSVDDAADFRGGCATHALWKETNLDAWNEPADEPKLQLYDAPQHKDVLVDVPGISERHDSVHTRSYWLLKNQKRIEQRREPEFVGFPLPASPGRRFRFSPKRMLRRPVFKCRELCGRRDESQFFLLYSSAQNGGPYRLPVYNDGVGQSSALR